MIFELTMALQKGAKAEIKDDRVVITIDTDITKRDLWDSQIEMWLSKKDDIKTLSSGYLRIIRNKLQFRFPKWQ